MKIRPANSSDLDCILKIYEYAREQMRLSGNPAQWGDNRPSRETVELDIAEKHAYVILNQQGQICGVFAFLIGEEPTYRLIENGNWLNDQPYGVIHRIAGNGKEKGVLAAALSWCEKWIKNIRIDTHEDNHIMQHLLQKFGYQRCGRIYVEDGSPRIAYQKVQG